MTEIGDHTGDTGTGAGEKVQETQKDITKGTELYLVANEVVTLEEETGIMAEAEVHEGAVVTTPTPSIKMYRDCMVEVLLGAGEIYGPLCGGGEE